MPFFAPGIYVWCGFLCLSVGSCFKCTTDFNLLMILIMCEFGGWNGSYIFTWYAFCIRILNPIIFYRVQIVQIVFFNVPGVDEKYVY